MQEPYELNVQVRICAGGVWQQTSLPRHPIGEWGGWNAYEFALNCAIGYTDAYGFAVPFVFDFASGNDANGIPYTRYILTVDFFKTILKRYKQAYDPKIRGYTNTSVDLDTSYAVDPDPTITAHVYFLSIKFPLLQEYSCTQNIDPRIYIMKERM